MCKWSKYIGNKTTERVSLFHYHLSAVQLKKKIDQFFVTFWSNKIVLSQQRKTSKGNWQLKQHIHSLGGLMNSFLDKRRVRPIIFCLAFRASVWPKNKDRASSLARVPSLDTLLGLCYSPQTWQLLRQWSNIHFLFFKHCCFWAHSGHLGFLSWQTFKIK